MKGLLLTITLFCLSFTQLVRATDQEDMDFAMQKAAKLLEYIQTDADIAIPQTLLDNAHGIAIFPGVIKAGFVIGGLYGNGVLLNKMKSGKWSPPVCMTIGGASFGFQIGGAEVDMVLVIMNKEGVRSLATGNITLGGDIGIAAGPVGRSASAEVGINMGILSYSRSKGLFAGVALNGAIISPLKKINQSYYGYNTDNYDVLLSGNVKTPDAALKLVKYLNKVAP